MFLAQKSYSEALGELKKVLSFDSENKDAQERINKIEQAQEEHNRKVNKLIQQYQAAKENNDFDAAITACSKLIDVDTPNQRKWTETVERLKSEKAEFAKEQVKWQSLKRKIDTDLIDEKWEVVDVLCRQALEIKEDPSIRQMMQKAKEKFNQQKIQVLFDEAFNIKDWKRVVELYSKYDFLKRIPNNNKILNVAKRLIMFGRKNGLIS